MKHQIIALPSIWQPLAQQSIFRAMLNASSYPGSIHDISEALDGETAILGALATLLDKSTTLCDPSSELTSSQLTMLGCPLAEIDQASFILAKGSLPPNDAFAPKLGTIYRPDQSATILLRCKKLGDGSETWQLTGPGIQSETQLTIMGCDSAWFQRRELWVKSFPMGVDFILCDDTQLAAIPRTTQVVRYTH